MGSRDLSPSTAIDQLKARYSTPLVVRSKDNPTKYAISDKPRAQVLRTVSALLKQEGCLIFLKARAGNFVAARKQWISLVEAETDDAFEVNR